MSLQAPAPAPAPTPAPTPAPALTVPFMSHASIESGRKRERELVPPVVSERSASFRKYVNDIHIRRVNEHEKKIRKIYGEFVPMTTKPPLSLSHLPK